MALANVALTDTFDVWRTRTNQVIYLLDEVSNLSTNASSNAANSIAAASAAFNKANSANIIATLAYGQANTSYSQANIAYGQANAAYGQANSAFDQGTLAFSKANTACTKADTAQSTASGAASAASAAQSTADGAVSSAAAAQGSASAAYNQANTAFDRANTAYNRGNTAFDHANSAYNKANTGGNFSGSVQVSGDIRVNGATQLYSAYSMNVYPVASNTINCMQGNYFTKVFTQSETMQFINVPTTGVYGFVFKTANGGASAYSITFANTVRWPGGTQPTLTQTTNPSSNADILVFFTDDGGTTWRGSLAQKDSR